MSCIAKAEQGLRVLEQELQMDEMVLTGPGRPGSKPTAYGSRMPWVKAYSLPCGDARGRNLYARRLTERRNGAVETTAG